MADVFGWLYSDPAPLARILLVGSLAYAGLVLLLRASGKRTLSKMNAFDLIVTVALGSSLATTILSKDTALLEGLLAFALLIFAQLAVTWASVRSIRVKRLIKAEPTLLVFRGQFLHETMKRERVTEEELLAVARGKGQADLQNVRALVLETDGTVAVLTEEVSGEHSTLRPLSNHDRLDQLREQHLESPR